MKQQGYVLLLSVMMIGALMVLVTSVIGRVTLARQTASLAYQREQARQLALSGIQCAYAQLAEKPEASPKKAEKPQAAAAPQQSSLAPWIKYCGWWQRYECTEELDGVSGTMQWYIAPEEGKLNLNSFYDFKKKTFVLQGPFDARKGLLMINERMKNQLGSVSLVKIIEELFKDRKEPLEDLTELKKVKDFEKIAYLMFPAPPEKDAPLVPTFMDLFTVTGTGVDVYPATLSLSMQAILGFPALKPETVKKQRAELAPQIKDQMNWQTSWDQLLQPLYKKSYQEMPQEIKTILSGKFEGNVFSVVSYGKFGSITERVYALIERTLSRDQRVEYVIRKIYWI